MSTGRNTVSLLSMAGRKESNTSRGSIRPFGDAGVVVRKKDIVFRNQVESKEALDRSRARFFNIVSKANC